MNSKINEQPEKKLGKYTIVSKLGRGAMGMVYKGFDPLIERHVALKTVSPELIAGADSKMETSIVRFKREAQTAGSLNHPNIVAVYEYGKDKDTLYIAMEFVQGQELKKIFKKNLKFGKVSQIVKLMTQLLGALSHSHENGVVHRDIKPGNIMVTPSGDIKVADFGIARIESSELTQIGTIIGTPSYMSPEQLTGQVIDARTDLFSAGIVFYQLLTGEKPFDGKTTTTIMHKILNETHVPPCALNPKLPKSFDYIMDKALAKNPDHRYQSASEFLSDIKQAEAGTLKSPAPAHETEEDDQTVIMSDRTQHADDTEIDTARILSSHREETKDFHSGPKGVNKPLIFAVLFLALAISAALFVYVTRFASDGKTPVTTPPVAQEEPVKSPPVNNVPAEPVVTAPPVVSPPADTPPAEPESVPAAEETSPATQDSAVVKETKNTSAVSDSPGKTEPVKPKPESVKPKPESVKPKPETVKPKPETVKPKPETEKTGTFSYLTEDTKAPEHKGGTKLTLRTERGRDRELFKNLSGHSGKTEISHVRTWLKLTTAFIDKTIDANDLPAFIEKSVMKLDIVSHVTGGPADIICILSDNKNGYSMKVQSSFFIFGEDEYSVIDVDKNNRNKAVADIYRLLSKLYCFNGFSTLEKINRVSEKDKAKLDITGSQDSVLYSGNKTDICIYPKQSSYIVMLNINSSDITLFYPNYDSSANFIEKGKSRCSGSMDIYPPYGTEMITSFMVNDKNMLSRFGYSLSEEIPYYSWGYDNGKAISFCENIILKLINIPKSNWSVVNQYVLIKKK